MSSKFDFDPMFNFGIFLQDSESSGDMFIMQHIFGQVF